MTNEMLDTALRNVAARLALPYCLYLDNKNVFAYIDDESGKLTIDKEVMLQDFNEEFRLLQIELVELQFGKYQQDKIDNQEA
jgi:hypothetical protein